MNEALRRKIEESWLAGVTPDRQRELLEDLYRDEPELKQDLRRDFETDIAFNLQYVPDEEMQQIFGRICAQLGLQDAAQTRVRRMKRVRLMKWVSAAAAAVVLMMAGYWFVRSGASGGEPVSAADGMASVEWLNNSGEEEERLMEDGSRIRLAAHSSISYQQHFSDHSRVISLSGKASFDVAKDSTRPFTVYAGRLATTALGTRFTVESSDSLTQVKLFEGKVLVRDSVTDFSGGVLLHPGEQVSYDNHKRQLLKVEQSPEERLLDSDRMPEADQERIRDLRTRDMDFVQVPLPVVFDTLQRRYNVRIIYDRDQMAQEVVTGRFKTDESLQAVLKILEKVNGFTFRRQDSLIYINK